MTAVRISGLCIACVGVAIGVIRGNWSAAVWATSTGLLWIRLMTL